MNEQLERRPEIFAAARAAGFKVTPAQLTRWTAFGLVEKPLRLGRGRGRGTSRPYPRGTTRRVLLICEIRHAHRALPEVAWELWMRGEDIPDRLVRGYLHQVVAFHDRVLAQAQEAGFRGPDVTEEAAELADKIARSRYVPSDLREGAGSTERVGTLVRTIIQVMVGTYDADAAAVIEPEDDDGIIVERAIGLERARTDQILGVTPWLKGRTSEELERTAHLLGGAWLPAIDAVSMDDLRTARDAWNDLSELLISVGGAFQETFGVNLAGFPAMARGVGDMSPEDRAMGVVMMLRMLAARDPVIDAGLAQLRDVLTGWRAQAVPAFEAMTHLRDEVPAFAAALAPERMRDVIATKADFDAHLQSLRPLGEEHEREVYEAMRRAGFDLSGIRPPQQIAPEEVNLGEPERPSGKIGRKVPSLRSSVS